MFARESKAFASALELGSGAVIDVLVRHVGPLLQRWQADDQIHPTWISETVRWMQSAGLFPALGGPGVRG